MANERLNQLLAGVHGIGLPPPNPTSMVVYIGDSKATISWKVPAVTTIEGQVVQTTGGVMIRRKKGEAPKSLTDGELAAISFELEGSLVETGLENGQKYFWRFFPFSDYGVCNQSRENIISATPQNAILYGFEIDKTNSDPYACVTYTDMAVDMTPAKVNLTDGSFDPGSWTDEIFFRKNNHVWMVKSDGTPDYQLMDDDYTKRLDGGDSDVDNTSYDGNAMVRFDTVWIKRSEEGDKMKVQICNVQMDENFHAYAHTREDGSIMDYIWMAAFRGSEIGTKLRSLSNQSPMNTRSGEVENAYAANNGPLWGTQTWSQIDTINMLLILMGKSLYSQVVFGNGHYTGGTGAANLLKTGTQFNKGAFYGTNGNVAVKVFHIENFYGDQWNRIRGMITNAKSHILVKNVPPYNPDGVGYIDTGIIPSGPNPGYINAAKMTEYGLIPQKTGGTLTTYFTDGLWYDTSRCAYTGGSISDGGYVGALALDLGGTFSIATWNVGTALSCEQKKEAKL